MLAGKEVEGRSGTILEGESGFNDPVGIALMIGMIELAIDPARRPRPTSREFLERDGHRPRGRCGRQASSCCSSLRRVPLPDRSLYPLAVVLAAGVVYGTAAVAHGSGFLAVFVAGHRDRRRGVSRGGSRCDTSTPALADLGELAVFVALGLTIDLGFIFAGALWWQGLVLAVLLGFVVRPLVVDAAAAAVEAVARRAALRHLGRAQGRRADPARLARRRRRHRAVAAEIYGIVFVVVLFSVVVQGTLVPHVAKRLGVPMTDAEP